MEKPSMLYHHIVLSLAEAGCKLREEQKIELLDILHKVDAKFLDNIISYKRLSDQSVEVVFNSARATSAFYNKLDK